MKPAWSIQHLESLQKSGKIRGFVLPEKPAPAKKKSKYGNTKVEVNRILFDSKKEAKRFTELLLLLKIGEIGLLERQVGYMLIEASETERKCEYVCDFRYIIVYTGETVVEDVKSEVTRKLSTYIMKRKLMASVHRIIIKEI